MRATVLMDNTPDRGLPGEWGLSVYIQMDGANILLDTGASDLFLRNAQALGLSVRDVDYAVLSHAHNDHAGGMEAFFRANDRARFYLRQGCERGCYSKLLCFHRYIGIPRHVLERFPERTVLVRDSFALCAGAYLIGHTTAGLEQIGRRNRMYVREGRRWQPDSFAHEQSLVLETEGGLAVFNSCSHGGVDNILRETEEAFPGRPVRAMIGGFHLFDRSEAEVRALAKRLRSMGTVTLYTGHCTGRRAYRWLREELGDAVQPLTVGTVIKL